jgi:ABC-type glycerol-3-phosphate transport system substrate-binding protein
MESRFDGGSLNKWYSLSSLLLMIVLVSCSPATSVPGMADHLTAELIRTDTPIAVVQEPTLTQPTTLEATPVAPPSMVIWWPEPLAPLNNAEANELLSEQISAFKAAQGNIDVQLRRKMESGVGGIMSTLRAASPVAPGALPDLTLMRRSDLTTAAQAGLIYPLEGLISSAISNDLYRAALSLGQVNDQLYGLPYLLEVQHMAFSPLDTPPPARFEDILVREISFALPVAQVDQINNVLMVQYLDAGGALPASDANNINVDALSSTLHFYEDALARGLIDPAVLNYISIADYQANLIDGTLGGGLINSTQYLNLLQSGAALDFGPVPTASGSVVGEVDGWMWVLTTSSADRQALAGRFLNWMLNAARQGEYSQAVNMIPSQRTALQTWQDSPYIRFLRQLLNNALPPVSDAESGSILRSVQNALVDVLSQTSTADQAAQDLLDRLSS